MIEPTGDVSTRYCLTSFESVFNSMLNETFFSEESLEEDEVRGLRTTTSISIFDSLLLEELDDLCSDLTELAEERDKSILISGRVPFLLSDELDDLGFGTTTGLVFLPMFINRPSVLNPILFFFFFSDFIDIDEDDDEDEDLDDEDDDPVKL